jgi:phosphatidylinositol-3,4,5-trisphosphate 3-phosphatase/dual-specificity protein phosphatase PTEN
MYDVTQSAKERGVVLDADREVRMKLYMGQVSRSLLPLF